MTRRRRPFGSVRKLSSGKWQARYRDPLTGKKDVAAPQLFTTRGDARRWLAKVEAGAIDPVSLNLRSEGRRLGEYASEWIATRALRPRTRELYQLQLRLHIAPVLGEAQLVGLQPSHIRRWHSDLVNGHLSAVSVAKVYRLLRSILNTAVEDGYLARNPCQLKRAGAEPRVERPIPTVDQAVQISAALPPGLAAVPMVAALAGLRKGEILGLARRHIDLAGATIHVERALQEITGQGAVFVSPKTTTSVRTVAVPHLLVEVLTAHLDQHVGPEPEALLFTNRYGRPVRASVWRAAWARATSETGCDEVRLHDLRHLAGTLTAQAGATLKEIMARLGHSSIEAAMRYQHVADQRADVVARRIQDLL